MNPRVYYHKVSKPIYLPRYYNYASAPKPNIISCNKLRLLKLFSGYFNQRLTIGIPLCFRYKRSAPYQDSSKTKAVGIKNGRGKADAFFIDDNVPDPIASSGRILVTIKAFGLNRMDIMQREDKYPYPLLPESGKILGVEFSGLVEEVGPDCK